MATVNIDQSSLPVGVAAAGAKAGMFVGAAFGALVLGVLDYITGAPPSFALLYVVPVACVGWFVGRAEAVVLALLSVAIGTSAEVGWQEVWPVWVHAWNTFTRLAIFLLAAIAAATLREDQGRIREANTELARLLEVEARSLRHSEYRFELLVDGMTDHAIVLFDPDGAARKANAGASALVGLPPHDLQGRTLDELFPAADPAPDARPLAELARASPHVEIERWTRRPDGSRYWASIVVYGAEQEATGGMLAVVRDATARKQSEDQVRRARDEALVLARELEAFSYTVAHDLRAPLRAIDGFGALLLEEHGPRLDERGRSHVARIRAAAQRMAQLLDALLELSRLGRRPIHRADVNLTDMARAVVEGISAEYPDRVVSVTIEEGMTARGDPALLEVVLQNLLSNAWKFSSRRERATIAVGSVPGEEPTFFVRDDGAGFDMQFAERLFRPFERLHSAEEFEGTGIGLAIVRRVIERHGGQVRAEGAVEGGATVYFTLPTAEAHE